MAFNGSSFLAGAGALLLTMAVGFGGGFVLTDAFVGQSDPREPSKLQKQVREAKSALQPAAAVAATLATEHPTVSRAPQQSIAERKPPIIATAPAQPAFQANLENAQAKARDAEIELELRRQEHVKRAQQQRKATTERKALAEHKRRKNAAMKALADRERRTQEETRPDVFRQGHDDDNRFGGLFRMH